MTVKEMEQSILEALGWRQSHAMGYPEWIDPVRDNSYGSLPNLSDPGVFWPMFEEWRQRKDHDYINISDVAPVHIDYQCRSLPSWEYTFRIYIGLKDAARFEAQAASQIGAGIRAWHASLVALGKIKETR